MLLGHRVSQKSILWPLVVVMLPGWLLLVTLARRPNAATHTQFAFNERVGQHMLAYDHAETLGETANLAARHDTVETLFRQAKEARIITDPQVIRHALIEARFGDQPQASTLLATVSTAPKPSAYFTIASKTIQNTPLSDDDKGALQQLRAETPGDWWLESIAAQQHVASPAERAAFESQKARAWWSLRISDSLLTVLAVLALLLALPALKALHSTWTIWPYSERIQRLWPVPLMLFVVSLRGLLLLLGLYIGGIIVPLFAWSGQRDPLTVYHIENSLSFVFNFFLLVGTTYAVKEIVAPRCGTLGEVLGLDLRDLRSRRLWIIAIPAAIALRYALAPLPALLDHWQIGGTSIYDGLSRSPAGYNTLGTLLSLLQAIVIAPFFEEVIYRGFLLSAFRNYFRPLNAILLTSLIFALAHGASFTGATTAFAYGIAYALLKLHTGRLSAAIVLHACVGVIQVVFALLNGG